MTTPLLPIQRSVRSARRRLFLQSLLNRVPVCWSVAMIGGLGWVIAEPFLAETPVAGVRWWVVGGLVACSTIVAWIWAKRATPSANSAALEIDTRFGLRERLTTAMGLSELERNTPAGQAVMADAAEKITPIAVKERFPVSPRWHTALHRPTSGFICCRQPARAKGEKPIVEDVEAILVVEDGVDKVETLPQHGRYFRTPRIEKPCGGDAADRKPERRGGETLQDCGGGPVELLLEPRQHIVVGQDFDRSPKIIAEKHILDMRPTGVNRRYRQEDERNRYDPR